MTEISREILDKYQIRKTGPQKSAFIDYMKEKYPHLRVESGDFPEAAIWSWAIPIGRR